MTKNKPCLQTYISNIFSLVLTSSQNGTGFDLNGFIRDANLTAASRSLSRDLIIGATAFTIWIAIEGRRLQVKAWWVSLILCVSVSFACGGPFFLYLRERRLLELEKDNAADNQNEADIYQ